MIEFLADEDNFLPSVAPWFLEVSFDASACVRIERPFSLSERQFGYTVSWERKELYLRQSYKTTGLHLARSAWYQPDSIHHVNLGEWQARRNLSNAGDRRR